MQGGDHHGLKRLNQPINQANPPKIHQFKKKKNCKLCSEEISTESNMLPGYVCQDPVLNLIPASK